MKEVHLKKNETLPQFIARFPKMVNSNGCWIPESDSSRYRIVYIYGEKIYLHRLSAHVFLGLDLNDKSTQVNHKVICSDKRCFNPDHIYVGTQSENIQDSVKAKLFSNSRKTHCSTCGGEYRTLYPGRRICQSCISRRQRNKRAAIRALKDESKESTS